MKNLNHHGHVYTSINELEKIFKRDYEILTIHHKVNYDYGNFYGSFDGIKILEYASFEIISNKKYWFRVQKPLIEILDNNKQYYFSIYGENICCLELFKIYTNLSVITCDEYIKNISSPYKVFKK
tara:strand:- start:954 stop:1328 length:375 start_codon:yes stop_codon:yes gene_type:complete